MRFLGPSRVLALGLGTRLPENGMVASCQALLSLSSCPRLMAVPSLSLQEPGRPLSREGTPTLAATPVLTVGWNLKDARALLGGGTRPYCEKHMPASAYSAAPTLNSQA